MKHSVARGTVTILARSVVALMLAFAILPAQAAPAQAATEDDYRALNRSIVENHILPRLAAFAEATAALQAAADRACTARTSTDLAALRETFIAAMDAWESVQHVRFGPIEYFSRRSRVFFWPDPRNSVGRQLGALLGNGSPDTIT